MEQNTRVRFEHSEPILRVEDLGASIRFYVESLGFQNAPWANENFTAVTRDGACIYLCQRDQGKGGAWAWVGVEDADRLYEEYKAKGVTVKMPPTDFAWAREMQVEDPDGNVLRFGSEPRK